jgi:AmmeMemoRadiSam system protein A
MSKDLLTPTEKRLLLKLARQILEAKISQQPINPVNMDKLPEKLRSPGASFVTLKKSGKLRGCIGTLEPYRPLVKDVCDHVIAAALRDYRFPPVEQEELRDITIEISRLTNPEPLIYDYPMELPQKIRPGIDGVVLCDGVKRATFLPQVWEKIPKPELFLNMLCNKMGNPADAWRKKKMEVYIYQVEEFHEQEE